MSDYTAHYNHLQLIHRKLLDHTWSRQQTQNDSAFIAWLDKELMTLSNEAYSLTQGYGIKTDSTAEQCKPES